MVDLGAEAAADVGRDHAQLVLRDLQHERAHRQPDDVRVLGRQWSVSMSEGASYTAHAARGSSAFGITRLLIRSTRATRCERPNA
jgi:hypothetical protein